MLSNKIATGIESRLRKTLGSSQGPAAERASLRLNEWSKICSEFLTVILDIRDLSQRSAELVLGFQIACIPRVMAGDAARVEAFQTTELVKDVQTRTARVSERLNRIAQNMENFKRLFPTSNEKAILKQIDDAREPIAILVRSPRPLNSEETSLVDNSTVPGIMESMSVLLQMKSFVVVNALIEEERGFIKNVSTSGATRNMSHSNPLKCLLGVGSMVVPDILATVAWIKRSGPTKRLPSRDWEYAVHATYGMLGDALNEFTRSLVIGSQGTKPGGSPVTRLFRMLPCIPS